MSCALCRVSHITWCHCHVCLYVAYCLVIHILYYIVTSRHVMSGQMELLLSCSQEGGELQRLLEEVAELLHVTAMTDDSM